MALRVLVTLAGDGGADAAHAVRERHLAALRRAGLAPVMVAGTSCAAEIASLLDEACACAYLPGGDYLPSRLDEPEVEREERAAAAGLPYDPFKVRADLAVVEAAWRLRRPLLGVCGGMQAMVLHAGGALRAGTASELSAHARALDRPVSTAPGSLAARACGTGELPANSFHRQLVEGTGTLLATAHAPDGTVEAVEAPPAAHPFWLGLQWHPELCGMHAPFEALAAAAQAG